MCLRPTFVPSAPLNVHFFLFPLRYFLSTLLSLMCPVHPILGQTTYIYSNKRLFNFKLFLSQQTPVVCTLRSTGWRQIIKSKNFKQLFSFFFKFLHRMLDYKIKSYINTKTILLLTFQHIFFNTISSSTSLRTSFLLSKGIPSIIFSFTL